jgi:RNA polymerase sigma factor (TIGR02999 family)
LAGGLEFAAHKLIHGTSRGWEPLRIIKQVVNSPVPQLLERLRGGDQTVLDELTATLYSELRRIAGRHLRRERPDHTLQTTALVHEAYLKLCGDPSQQFTGRTHFLAIASRVMRQVLVDYARARATGKRGDGARNRQEGLETASLEVESEAGPRKAELLDLDRALEVLGQEDESLARIVEMKYFGGMTAEETAEALGRSVHVVRHDLRFAEAWLRRKLSP